MTTITDVLDIQAKSNVLLPPEIVEESVEAAGTLSIGLYNSTTSSTVYAYITGLASSKSNAVFLLQSDGVTPYYPTNPSSNGTALSANCAIALGAPGTTRTVSIPYLAGGRIWFCVGNTLTFLLNNGTIGPGLVEPSVSNPTDPNYNLTWDFCEFTYNSSQVYANISYVDFVCLPIALTCTSTSGAVTHVGGLPANGLTNVCNGLIAQNAKDGAGWDQLVISKNGSFLRALSPSNGIVLNSSLFANYWTSYIDSVWTKYISTPLVIDTQASWGTVQGFTSNDRTTLNFSGIGSFTKPSATDIFGANTGAFAAQTTNTDELLNLGARIDAAINRSTLLINANQPDNEVVSTYYTNTVTNHYSRIVHAANVDGRGYTFPYDDVTPNGGVDQSGFVSDGSPSNLLVTVGGGNAYAKRSIEQSAPTRRMKREVHWDEDLKAPQEKQKEKFVDLELGAPQAEPKSKISLPPFVERAFGPYLTKLRETPFYAEKLRPLLDLISQFLISFLSLSLRAILSRIFLVILFILFYFLGLLPHGGREETQRRIVKSAVAAGSGNGTFMVNGS